MKAARDETDIDQKTIAEALGVSESAVSRWEGNESIPNDRVMVRIAEYFGVTPAWLRYGQPPRELIPDMELDVELPDPTKDRRLIGAELARAERQAEREERQLTKRATTKLRKGGRG